MATTIIHSLHKIITILRVCLMKMYGEAPVQSAGLFGSPYDKCFIDFSDIIKSGTLT